MSSSEVGELISALRTGEVTLAEVADCFRRRSWPRTRRPTPATSLEIAEQQDPEADVPGSYDDLTGAYDKGQLTAEQYDALSQAVAESIRAEAERSAGR
jgi:predicted RNA-binding protein associated with RNAse of E/G family